MSRYFAALENIRNEMGIDLSDQETRRRLAQAWGEAYLTNSHGDAHGKFAELINLTRPEAKTVCYALVYTADSHVTQDLQPDTF